MEMREKEEIKEEENIVHPLDKIKKERLGKPTNIVAIVLVLALGLGTGFLLSQLTIAGGIIDKKVEVRSLGEDDEIKIGLIVGVDDKKQFPDIAEGELEEGGIDGEGTHHLKRPGGESQNVYLTSSNVDLGKFINKKVKVNGKTFEAEKAGWFMDVGQLEVLK